MTNISVPAAAKTPRELSQDELDTLGRVAAVLIPAHHGAPPASAEPGFWEALTLALDARADAFGDIANALHGFAYAEPEQLWALLESLDSDHPVGFQALSTVIAGAWLLTPGVRHRIGYHGQLSEKASLGEAVDEISSGVLDPVLERDPAQSPRWIR